MWLLAPRIMAQFAQENPNIHGETLQGSFAPPRVHAVLSGQQEPLSKRLKARSVMGGVLFSFLYWVNFLPRVCNGQGASCFTNTDAAQNSRVP